MIEREVSAMGRSILKSGKHEIITDPDHRLLITPYGFEHDRVLCLAAPSARGNGYEVLTQRRVERLSQISTLATADFFVLSAPGMVEIEIGHSQKSRDYRRDYLKAVMPHTKNQNEIQGRKIGGGASDIIAGFLDIDGVELLGFNSNKAQHISPYYWREDCTNKFAFQDGSPISVGFEEADALVNQQIVANGKKPVSSVRWRRGIQVRGGEADDQFYVNKFFAHQNGQLPASVRLVGVGMSTRCAVTEVDERTGKRQSKVVLPALAEIAKGVRTGDGETGVFQDVGFNIPWSAVGNYIGVGDKIRISRSAKPDVKLSK